MNKYLALVALSALSLTANYSVDNADEILEARLGGAQEHNERVARRGTDILKDSARQQSTQQAPNMLGSGNTYGMPGSFGGSSSPSY